MFTNRAHVWLYVYGRDIYGKEYIYKNGDKNSLLGIIEIFNPLINKYSRLLDKGDTR